MHPWNSMHMHNIYVFKYVYYIYTYPSMPIYFPKFPLLHLSLTNTSHKGTLLRPLICGSSTRLSSSRATASCHSPAFPQALITDPKVILSWVLNQTTHLKNIYISQIGKWRNPHPKKVSYVRENPPPKIFPEGFGVKMKNDLKPSPSI